MAATEMVLFESSDGAVTLPVEVDVAHDEVWLTRHQMSELFGRDIKTIGRHVNSALKEELAAIELSQKLRQLLRTARRIRWSTTG